MIPTSYPSLDLVAADGARATIALDGAHVTSWVPAGTDGDRLFVSERSGFGAGVSIRGGIPVIFPQFGAEGSLPRHGFARTSHWTVTSFADSAHDAHVTMRLSDSAATRAVWPATFRADLTVRVHGAVLDVSLSVTNAGDAPFSFTAALHPYFRVVDAYQTTVSGLHQLRYRDALRDRQLFEESDATVHIHGEIDRVYFDVPNVIEIHEIDRVLRIEKRGFPDAVVWNPGAAGTRGRADFKQGDQRDMLCVEAAAVQHPIVLSPGSQWTGSQVMTAV